MSGYNHRVLLNEFFNQFICAPTPQILSFTYNMYHMYEYVWYGGCAEQISLVLKYIEPKATQ